jgi:Ca2+-binding EF-hand superfamily protein
MQLVFQKYDTDDSGFIDVGELGKMIYDMGHKLNEVELVAATQQLDKNGDGRISYEEFMSWWSRGEQRFSSLELSERAQKQLAASIDFFKYYDKDRSGTIDRAEFKPVYESLKAAGHQLGTIDQALTALDKSGDGLISLNEYVNWLINSKILKLE